MTVKFFKAILILPLCAAAITSCKDDEETEVLPSLTGNLTLNYADFEFVDVGDRTVTFVPSGVTHPEGGAISYSWQITPDMDSSEKSENEDGSYVYTFPDSLGTYTVNCTASADGYYSSGISYYATVVSATKSLTDMELEGLSSITDDRDGKTYRITEIGGVSWFCENLKYAGAGTPYSDSEPMSDIFGRFYTFNELENVCPDGWSVPSEEDWTALAKALWEPDHQDPENPGSALVPDTEEEYFNGIAGKLMVNAKFNTALLWEMWPAVDITNESRLAMIPVGIANISGNTRDFSGVNTYAAFWTSSPDGEDRAFYKYLICGSPNVYSAAGDISSFAINVRCIRK